MAAGALDVHYKPIFMKKNRPAWELTVICDEHHKADLESIIFTETTTIGIRCSKMTRTILPRRKDVVQTSYGEVEVKLCSLDKQEYRYVEFASAVRLAQTQGVALQEIYDAVKETSLIREV